MSFINNLKGIADKAGEELKKAAEDVKNKTNEETALSGNDLMNNLKSMASKASEEAKKNQFLSGSDLSSRHKMEG